MNARQLPEGDATFLDHAAFFVPDMEAAAAALVRLGFTPTPFTRQFNQTPGGAVPAGMANCCLMLRQGYVELLTAVSKGDLARQFEAAIERHVGLHLVAFGVADADAAHARLGQAGLEPSPPVHLRREVDLVGGGRGEARFTVLRLPPGLMPEGRMQLLTHHTEATVWQDAWMEHPNGVASLEAVLIVVADLDEAAARFGRLLDRAPVSLDDSRRAVALDRGRLVLASLDAVRDRLPAGIVPPPPPWIAGLGLGAADPAASAAWFKAAGLVGGFAAGEGTYALPVELGGFVTLTRRGVTPSWAG